MMSEQPASLGPAEVGAILEQLRTEVRARRLARGVAAEGPLERDLGRALDELELHRVVSAHWPLTARTLPGRVVALVNKIVRRALRWYINPIVEQQNAFNAATVHALQAIADALAQLVGEQPALRQQLADIEQHLRDIDEAQTAIARKLSALDRV